MLNAIKIASGNTIRWVHIDYILEGVEVHAGDEDAVEKVFDVLGSLVSDGSLRESEFVSMGPGYREYENGNDGDPVYILTNV